MTQLTPSEKKILLTVAYNAIDYGLNDKKIILNLKEYPGKLKQTRASFVTLNLNKKLRGCIGSLVAYQPLIQDVSKNAYAAAFSDPRFMPVTKHEFSSIHMDISILNSPEPMKFVSEGDLISQLRPGIDGLILSDLGRKGTFLPSVWKSLDDSRQFLMHLKQKAGLPSSYWSNTLKVERYTVETISSDIS